MKKSLIICVDDEKVILTSLKAQLRKAFDSEIAIETCESAEEALDLVDYSMKNDYDIPVIISDHIMPGMKGDEFLYIMHQKSRKTLSILLTGQADAEAVGRALNRAKLYRYISKPWEEPDLVLTIKEALRSYLQGSTIEEQKLELEKYVVKLKEYNETLEQKVMERTSELFSKSEILERQKNEIEIQKNNLTISIHYAERIQSAVFPTDEIISENFPEHFVLFKPLDIVSGDFYWYLQNNNDVFVAVADCTGHGVPGAFMSILGITFLNEIVHRSIVCTTNELLDRLSSNVIRTLHQSQNNSHTRDGMEVALCRFDLKNKRLQFAGAFRPMFMIRENLLHHITGDNMPIGIYDDEERKFTSNDITLKKDDIIYLFTDGYVDQIGGADRKTFKTNRFKELLLDIFRLPMTEQKQVLERKIEEWKGEFEQIDDILVLGIKITD
jgi:sigma-B regulation protein RsbU (phosphoserine phosphatase)